MSDSPGADTSSPAAILIVGLSFARGAAGRPSAPCRGCDEIALSTGPSMGYAGKRLLDVAVSLTALALFAPIMLVIALLVAIRMGRPVLFRQVRPGAGARPFSILKFRTMRDAVDSQGNPLPDRDRLTKFGRFLRASSLDELPGLINVLTGDMSLVGPRPLLEEYDPYYTPRERLRFTVRPGVTGWAQVNGRNSLGWDQRLEHDVWYVEHCSLWLDLKILLMTVDKVLRRADVHADPTHIEKLSDERRRLAEQSVKA